MSTLPESTHLRDAVASGPAPASGHRWPDALSLGLFFVSGAAALVYQVLWVRELRLLFGSTAQSAAIAIAIFFAGIAVGGAFWGRRIGRSPNALRTFGLLEIGVAAAALGHFAVIGLYYRLYPTFFSWFGSLGWGDTVMKAAVATTLLFPAAFLMGGTLPAMGEHLIRRRDPSEQHDGTRRRLATTGTTVYAINTLGSASGALAAGFVLPQVLGYHWAYLAAITADLTVGLIAIGVAMSWRLISTQTNGSSHHSISPPPEHRPSRVRLAETAIPVWLIWTIAVTSGVTTLSVEIIWTRLFAQVLQNSAYTFSIVLTTFLLALSLGAVLAGQIARTSVSPTRALIGLLAMAGVATAISPVGFHLVTDGLTYVGGDLAWGPYLARVGGIALVAMGLPAIALGAVLPYLLRILGDLYDTPGGALGRLIAANTTGAIVGSLAGGFVVLPLLGAWRGLLVMAAVYPVLAIATWLTSPVTTKALTAPSRRIRLIGGGTASFALIAAALIAPTTSLTDAGVVRPGELLVESRQGPQANVAVVADGDDLAIRVNTNYTLGGTKGLSSERDQALIPLLTHQDPRSVFFLGMGTGLTAGAALSLPLERVVVCELIDDVVAASRDHFGDFTNGLFEDARVSVISEDGRNCLARNTDRYDVIISDLFVPWEAGTGYLYSREHYEIAASRLESGGAYVQWIPLYQVSDRELGIIAKTMDEVFDQVVAWRGDLLPARSAIALVGHLDDAVLDPSVIAHAARSIDSAPMRSDLELQSMLLRLYLGNITASGIFDDRRSNTDTRPLIEQLTPQTQREVRAGRASFVVGHERERFYDELTSSMPPASDPYLSELKPQQLDAVHSGRIYSRYRLANLNESPETPALFESFERRSPVGSTRDLSPARTLLPRRLAGSGAMATGSTG